MKTPLELAYERHEDWITTVQKLGIKCEELAEDIVQEAYIKLHEAIHRGIDVSYEDDINHLYFFKILNSLTRDYQRAETKNPKVSLENYLENEYIEPDQDNEDYRVDDKMLQVQDILNSLYWYDAKVFEILSGDVTVAELSRNTGISYYSLYNTYKNVKDLIKKKVK